MYSIYPMRFVFLNVGFSIQIITCVSCCSLVLYLCWSALWHISAPVHGCFVSAAWLPRLLRQHSVVLRVHRGPCWTHSADLHWNHFSSSLTHTDVALWSHGEQRGPWDWPNKSNLILGWCVQACLYPLWQWTRRAGAPFATSVCTQEWTCMSFMGNWTCERCDESRCCFVTTDWQRLFSSLLLVQLSCIWRTGWAMMHHEAGGDCREAIGKNVDMKVENYSGWGMLCIFSLCWKKGEGLTQNLNWLSILQPSGPISQIKETKNKCKSFIIII